MGEYILSKLVSDLALLLVPQRSRNRPSNFPAQSYYTEPIDSELANSPNTERGRNHEFLKEIAQAHAFSLS
jgi:hypothetical protein